MTGRGHRTIAALVITSVITCVVAGPAKAAVVLRSAELSGDTGSAANQVGQTPTYSVTPFGPLPFPNDEDNFAGVGPEGLRVRVNRLATASGNTSPMGATRVWTNQSFSVVFELDEAAPFRYFRAIGQTDDGFVMPTLQAAGQAPITLRPFNETVGTLAPGVYTFSGATNFGVSSGPTNGPFNTRTSFTDVTLTVVPEPATLPLLAAGCLFLRRRPRAVRTRLP